MAAFLLAISAAVGATVVWLAVKIVNRPDRWEWEWICRLEMVLFPRLAIGYFVISSLTLPFLDSVWLSGIPLLALIQLPKVWLAKFCQSELVIRGMNWSGLSRGSMSPSMYV